MLNNTAIDVCLGIVFIVLLYSLLATIVQEIIAAWIGIRSRMLRKAISRMLEDHRQATGYTLVNFLVDLWRSFLGYFRPMPGHTFTAAFYRYPLIKYLAENSWSSKPAYISAANFSQVVIQLLLGNANAGNLNPVSSIRNNLLNGTYPGFRMDAETHGYLIKLLNDSGDDLQKFTASLERWYDDTMQRCTGWYKRQTQVLLFIIGMVIAGLFNVDMIAIANTLAHDDKAREALVSMAISHQERYGRLIDSIQRQHAALAATDSLRRDTTAAYAAVKDTLFYNTYRRLQDDAERARDILGLGRRDSCTVDQALLREIDRYKDSLCRANALDRRAIEALQKRYEASTSCITLPSPYQDERFKLGGWLLTALAISLGAPFWYDLLSKIILLRTGGTRPAPSSAAGGAGPAPSSAENKDAQTIKRVG